MTDSSTHDSPPTIQDRRYHEVRLATTPRRRGGDTLFSRARGQAFLVAGAGLGLVLLAYLLYWLSAD